MASQQDQPTPRGWLSLLDALGRFGRAMRGELWDNALAEAAAARLEVNEVLALQHDREAVRSGRLSRARFIARRAITVGWTGNQAARAKERALLDKSDEQVKDRLNQAEKRMADSAQLTDELMPSVQEQLQDCLWTGAIETIVFDDTGAIVTDNKGDRFNVPVGVWWSSRVSKIFANGRISKLLTEKLPRPVSGLVLVKKDQVVRLAAQLPLTPAPASALPAPGGSDPEALEPAPVVEAAPTHPPSVQVSQEDWGDESLPLPRRLKLWFLRTIAEGWEGPRDKWLDKARLAFIEPISGKQFGQLWREHATEQMRRPGRKRINMPETPALRPKPIIGTTGA